MSNVPPVPSSTVPSVLLPELLGFVPQFLLDDIVDTANDAVKQAVDAMEQFLERWADARREKNVDWDSTQEIEQGLVAFQTLLNTHVDIAFDFFETWSLRNIFAVPSDLPIVAPHQEGLTMDKTVEEEVGLEAEIRELRKRIHAQRKLERLLTTSVRLSHIQRTHASRRLAQLSFLRSPQMQSLLTLPDSFLAMYDAVTSLPPSTGEDAEELSVPLPEPGKRMWETNKTGYVNWAVDQLLARTREQEQAASKGGSGSGSSGGEGGVVASVVASAVAVGSTEDVKATILAMASPSNVDGGQQDMDVE
ncbi:Mis12 protein-domain-containing protein [Irpex rosettiformis]|uniref:Mis12 protein-domain-containing protein n=1 Tax=Irpex rosettiformis TaxID=378272 RepID=A0ACB8U3G0_9APHY|nr:Mis12 protein-domain-containing protein [Irpex rosettiformis]